MARGSSAAWCWGYSNRRRPPVSGKASPVAIGRFPLGCGGATVWPCHRLCPLCGTIGAFGARAYRFRKAEIGGTGCSHRDARGGNARVAHGRGGAALVLITPRGGCAGPLGPRDGDYAPSLPAERFRQLEPMRLEPRAEQPDPDQFDPVKLAADRFAGLERLGLSLEQCRASALANNLDLRVALVNPTIAGEALTAEEAAFEATFQTRALWRESDSPTASELADARSEFGLIEPSVQVPLRTGGLASVALPISRSWTNNQFATLNPAWNTDLQFSLSHPLLRGAGRRATTHGIRIASYSLQVSEAQTRLGVIAQLAAVDRAYWRLYLAREELSVRQQQLELAQAQLERAERMVRAERLAPIEVIRAQAGVAQRLEAIIVAQNEVLRAQRELKRIINMPGLDVDTPTLIEPVSPPDPLVYEIDPEKLAAIALVQRAELLELELRLAQDAAEVTFRENQALPRLDAAATYTINGLGGSLGDSLDMMTDNRFQDWSVGLTGSIPLGNEAARARLRQAVLTRIQRLSSKAGREQVVRQEVYDAVDRLGADWQRIVATRQAVILNTRALEAEQRLFEQGMSTTTDVLDAEARLADARSAEARAIVDYQLSQVNLAVATGTLLGATRVSWDAAPAPEMEGTWYTPRAPRN
jgi:outer membrane protein